MIVNPAAQIYQDPAAAHIGQAYRRGTEAYQETGRLLIAQKEKLRHGEWLPWLKANETALGFGEATAQRLMKWAANPSLDAETVWGNPALTRDLPEPALPVDPAQPREPFTTTRRDVGTPFGPPDVDREATRASSSACAR